MDFTPRSCGDENSHDSGCVSGLDSSSSSLFESTPKYPVVPLSRKRKFESRRLLHDVLETVSPPPFTSTLNESLLDNLEQLEIDSSAGLPPKRFIFDGERQYHSAPCTPEKQHIAQAKRPPNLGFYRETLALSPIKEAREILYSNIKPVPSRKILTPQKFKDNVKDKLNTPIKKCLFKAYYSRGPSQLLDDVINNDVVMKNVFRFLSNGDLYRLSMVSRAFRCAIFNNGQAFNRFQAYREVYRINKENYHITPPGSPEKNDSLAALSESRNFYEFFSLGKSLKPNQRLGKCPVCEKPSIIENDLSQCQNRNCGYIYCQLCLSCSMNGPENFIDTCKNSELLQQQQQQQQKSRSQFEDLSNHDRFYSFINSTPIDSSGFLSESDTPPIMAKRNLFGDKGKPKILAVNNRLYQKQKPELDRTLSFVPVVKGVGQRMILDPPSPPPKPYAIGSKQSKRNLKRLTR